MKIVKKKRTENCNFYSREISLYIAWACFRNEFKITVYFSGFFASSFRVTEED